MPSIVPVCAKVNLLDQQARTTAALMLWFTADTSTCVSQWWHLEEFLVFPTCSWTPDPEVNFVGLLLVRDGRFAAVLQHFSASVHLDVEAQGGGDAGSLTPRCSATPIRCTY